MRRIGFRRVLPLVFTLVHVVLVWYTPAQQRHGPARVFRDSEYRSVAYQEDAGVPIELLEAPPLKPAQKVSTILDLPAVFVATLIGAVLLPRNEAAWMYLSIPLVAFVWCAIGRWLDGLLGYIPRVCLPRTLRGLVTVTAVGILGVSIAGLTPLYHHRTADTYWIFTGIALWAGLCLAIMFSSPARDQ